MGFELAARIVLLTAGTLLIFITVWKSFHSKSQNPKKGISSRTIIRLFGLHLSTDDLKYANLFLGTVLMLAALFYSKDSETQPPAHGTIAQPQLSIFLELKKIPNLVPGARLSIEAPPSLTDTRRFRAFQEKLAEYGIRLDAQATDKLVINSGGYLELHVQGKKKAETRNPIFHMESLVEPESIQPPSRIRILAEGSGGVERMSEKALRAEMKAEVRRCLALLEEGYNQSDLAKLKSIFKSDGMPRILIGKVDRNDEIQWENVEYELLTTPDYLARLQRMISHGREFSVDIRPIEIYRESEQRYWVLAHQEWITFDETLSANSHSYTDDGFLILSLQRGDDLRFDPKIHFRIWINNYRYAGQEGGRKVPPDERVLEDFEREYRKVTGIRTLIAEQIRSDLAMILKRHRRELADFPKIVSKKNL